MSAGILYLHGFCSSPASWKARILADQMSARGQGDRFFCPALSTVPHEAISQAEAIIEAQPEQLTLVGSSLGGFYATCLAEKFDLRAVLINPAVVAPISLNEFIGTQTNLYTNESFEFTAEHVEQLRALELPRVTPERYLLLVETGDEVLDYRQAVSRYAGCQQMVLEGGDHSCTRFPDLLPQLLEFCGL
ncbi:YqiA/YcfP family alpha/beta fold hydrolase [Propionivibrio sp.]|uniref:YqiA/YcfP family alpha/beta fold hydrolase n=1 Tax=Propionivibrio sp. TaxID=2212460 RepID=UPI003BF1B937